MWITHNRATYGINMDLKQQIKPKYIFLILVSLLVLGGFFRFYQLEKAPYWMDEGYTINAVLSVEEKGSTILDSGEKYRCPTYCHITAYIAERFGNNAFSFRFLSVIAGILSIALIFYTTKRFFGNIVAITSTFFITFSYWQIAWSRQARWYTLFALFFWLAILFFDKFLKSDKSNLEKYLFLTSSLVFSFLASITHGLGYLMPFIFMIWYFVEKVIIEKKASWKRYVLGFILITGTILILDSLLGTRFYKGLLRGINLDFNPHYYIYFLIKNYWLFILPMIYTLYTSIRKKKFIVGILFFIFLAYLLPLSFLTKLVNYRYIFHVTPILIILGSLGIYDIYLLINKKWQKIAFILCIIILFFSFGKGVLAPKNFYFLESDTPKTWGKGAHYSYTPQPDWNKAYDFIKSNMENEDLVISSLPHFNKIFLGIPGYWIKYNYLGITGKESKTKDNKEFYVGAETINNLSELKELASKNHGYIVLDFMAIDEKIQPDILEYITNNFAQVFYDRINTYSRVWIYRF
mgnify:CR=1 FL=1